MARFGQFKFGERKFGAEVVDARLTWALEIDWDGDGLFNGYNDAQTMFSLETERGRKFFLASSSGFEPVMVGKLSVDILDLARRYDPYNPASPLYKSLLPGTQFRLRVRRESDGAILPVMSGEIDDIRPEYGSGKHQVRITGVDAVRRLKDERVSSAVYENIQFKAAIEKVLIDAGFGEYVIDQAVSDSMRYWWSRGNSAFWELDTLTNAVLGYFYVAADGRPTYKSRLPGDSPVTLLDDTDVLLGTKVYAPWEVVRNVIRVYARARRQVNNVVLWSLVDVPFVPAGESRTIWAEFSYNNAEVAALAVTTPVPGTDYSANTASDGSGTDLTGSVSVTLTAFASSAKLVVKNNGGSGAYLISPKLRGNAIVVDSYTYAEARNEASIARYRSSLDLVINSDWLQDVNTASEHASILLQRLQSQKKFPRLQVLSPERQFVELFDLVTVNLLTEGIGGEMRVAYIKHKSTNRTCDVMRTELHLEPDMTGNVSGNWVFPAVFNATTVFA